MKEIFKEQKEHSQMHIGEKPYKENIPIVKTRSFISKVSTISLVLYMSVGAGLSAIGINVFHLILAEVEYKQGGEHKQGSKDKKR